MVFILMVDIFFFLHSQGPLEESTVTGRLEPKEAPVWKRRAFRYLVSFPVIGLCLLLVFAVMFAMLQFQVSVLSYIWKDTVIVVFYRAFVPITLLPT